MNHPRPAASLPAHRPTSPRGFTRAPIASSPPDATPRPAALDADMSGGARPGLRTVWVSGGRQLPASSPAPDHTVLDAAAVLHELSDAELPAGR